MKFLLMVSLIVLQAGAVFAQDHPGRRPQLPQDVTLDILIITPEDKPDMHDRMELPKGMTRNEKIDACAAELARFLKHKFPVEGAQAQIATCIVPLNIKDEDS